MEGEEVSKMVDVKWDEGEGGKEKELNDTYQSKPIIQYGLIGPHH